MVHASYHIRLAALALMLACSIYGSACAELLDKIVASVDDRAITYRELELERDKFLRSGINISHSRTLDIMIDRLLMLREAKKLLLKGDSEDQIIQEYINLKIRAFVTVREVTVRNYYKSHKEDFSGVSFDDARRDIRAMLVDRITNTRLRQALDMLKRETDIRIYIENDG